MTKKLAIGLIVFFSVVSSMGAFGARFNRTPSIPVGLYWVVDKSIELGDYVTFCPSNSDANQLARERGYIDYGNCPGNFGLLMKRILAAKTDAVMIDVSGVWVNGNLLAFSKPLDKDPFGRALPFEFLVKVLDESEVLLMSDVNPESFDGRYFGVVNKEQIKEVISPVFVW